MVALGEQIIVNFIGRNGERHWGRETVTIRHALQMSASKLKL